MNLIPRLLCLFGCVAWLTACQSRLPAQSNIATTNKSEAASPKIPDPVARPIPSEAAANLWTRTQGEDWRGFLGPRGDGTSTETGVKSDLWQPHPELKWALPLGMSYGGPAVAKGRVLQFDREGDSERLRALNAETGELLWTWKDKVDYEDMYGYNNGPRCMPIVDGDLVYVYGVAGKLSCVTLADGQTIWQRDLNTEFDVIQNFFGVASAPCIYNEDVLVMVGGSPPESRNMPLGRLDMVIPNGSAIVAFDKRTGKQKYRVGKDLASYSTPVVRQINGKDVGLVFARSGLLGWDASNGHELFSYPWRAEMRESVNAAQPVVAGNQILISEAYAVASTLLELDNNHKPKVVWQDGTTRSTQAFRAHWSTPILIDGYLYGCSGRNEPDSDFRCVRLADAKVMWNTRRHQRASVLQVDGYLVVLYEYGELELVKPNAQKYEVVETADLSRIRADDGLPMLDRPCWAAPVLSHGLLLVRGNSHLLCFDLIPAP